MTERYVDTDFSSLIDRLNGVSDTKVPDAHDLLQVNGVAGNVFYVYETVRNAVEDKEQALFRKDAINRYLKRKFRFTRKYDPMARELIVELTKTRYLKNDTITNKEITEFDQLLSDYLTLYDLIARGLPAGRADQIFTEILSFAAVEIERCLVPRRRDEIFADFVFNSYLKHSDISSVASYEERTFSVGLYSAVLRALYHSDTAMIKSYLFLATFGEWNQSPEKLAEVAAVYNDYSLYVGHALEGKLARNTLTLVRRTISPYLVLRQIVVKGDYTSSYFTEDIGVQHLVREVCNNQYHKAKEALANSVLRSVLFIVLTKMLLAVLIEIPYDLASGELALLPIGINLLFPPIYLVLVGATTKIPDERNTKKILSDVNLIVYEGEENALKYVIRDGSGSGSFISVFFNSLYALTFVISIALLLWLLHVLHFNIVDSVVFFIFLSTVSFFGFRIGRTTKELVAIDQKRSPLYVFFDFLYTPFIAIGQWLSEKYSKINILTFVLDFIIEAPLKSILHVFDQWTTFIKDKKDELVS